MQHTLMLQWDQTLQHGLMLGSNTAASRAIECPLAMLPACLSGATSQLVLCVIIKQHVMMLEIA